MLKNITRALPLSLLVVVQIYANDAPDINLLNVNTTNKLMEQHGPGFASLEHRNQGDLVQLHLSEKNTAEGPLKPSLPNVLSLIYGEIVMYAADLFGDPDKTISNCDPKDRLSCFHAQFYSMAIKGKPNDKKCASPLNQAFNIADYKCSKC